MMICEIQEYEGEVYAVHSSHNYTTPTGSELWWKLATSTGIYDVGAQAIYDSGLGVFRVDYNGISERSRVVHCANPRRDAQADRVIEFGVPPPKTRLDTRWRDGRWEKRYATGWR